jgi:hypothetical protein
MDACHRLVPCAAHNPRHHAHLREGRIILLALPDPVKWFQFHRSGLYSHMAIIVKLGIPGTRDSGDTIPLLRHKYRFSPSALLQHGHLGSR